VFKRARHCFLLLSDESSSYPHPTCIWSILILTSYLRLGLRSSLLLSGFPTEPLFTLFLPMCSMYISFSSHPAWLEHFNNIWWTVQFVKTLIMKLSPASYYQIFLGSKYSPQHPVLRYLQSMFLPYFKISNFTPMQNYRKIHKEKSVLIIGIYEDMTVWY
jgi:hypothetical protein